MRQDRVEGVLQRAVAPGEFLRRADRPLRGIERAGAGEGGAHLAYRYGLPGKVELEYRSMPANGLLFHGQVEPVAPNASVREVWFDKGGTRYLMTACEGGDCPYASGLAVLSRGKVLANQHCRRTTPDRGFFAPEFADFGGNLNDSQSRTPLLKLETDENLIEQLYPIEGVL